MLVSLKSRPLINQQVDKSGLGGVGGEASYVLSFVLFFLIFLLYLCNKRLNNVCTAFPYIIH